jgi:MFS family permease
VTSAGFRASAVGRALGSFHPASVPALARGHYRRELVAWLLLPIMMGAVEGGVVSVLAKNAFDGTVPERVLNLVVGLLSGAPAFANVTSFLWASLSHGRHKIRFLVGLQLCAVVLVAQVAFAPASGTGLLMLTLAAVCSRMCWSGVVTLRTTVWRANYPRHLRARLAGRLATVQALVLAGVGLCIGAAMRADASSYHVLYPIAAACGAMGAVAYSRMRMRGHAALLVREQREVAHGRDRLHVLTVLRDDVAFRRYMMAMFVFGIGNLMVTAPLVIMLHDSFGFGYVRGILITATIPLAVMPFAIPLWARLLDRMHIVRFRVIHCWAFIASNTALLAAALTGSPALLWLAAGLKGIAFAGGVLGWNLGHHDFAHADRASSYMGVHVTLTGIRGLIGPLLAVEIYQALEQWHPGGGAWVFALCLALNLAGGAGFAALLRSMPDSKPPAGS